MNAGTSVSNTGHPACIRPDEVAINFGKIGKLEDNSSSKITGNQIAGTRCSATDPIIVRCIAEDPYPAEGVASPIQSTDIRADVVAFDHRVVGAVVQPDPILSIP